MSHLFDQDNPVMAFLGRVGDLVWLNILTILCCIPVITIGAALTALYYVSIKMVRNEEGYLTKSYFKSFKENFAQATVLWILMLLLFGVAGADFYYISMLGSSAAFVMRIVVCAVFFFFLCSSIYWFPLLSKFENSIKNTVKNACLVGISHFPKTFCILVLYIFFVTAYVLFWIRMIPLIFLVGISLPVYLSSYLFSGIFKKLEPKEEEIGQSV